MLKTQLATGLGLDERGQRYLAEVYHMRYRETVDGIPIFEDTTGELHVGGYKGMYTILRDIARLESLDTWRAKRTGIHYSFSVPENIFHSKRVDMVLTIQPGLRVDDRFSLYERNACKHVRRAESSPIEYVVEAPPEPWYELYARHCARLGSTPHARERYQAIERYMGESVVNISAYDQGLLIGTLYCIRTVDYIQLAVIASDIAYRPMRVDNGLYDAAIQYAIRENISTVDFGPTMVKDESHWKIKESYGAQQYFFADHSFVGLHRRVATKTTYAASRLRARLSKYVAKIPLGSKISS